MGCTIISKHSLRVHVVTLTILFALATVAFAALQTYRQQFGCGRASTTVLEHQHWRNFTGGEHDNCGHMYNVDVNSSAATAANAMKGFDANEQAGLNQLQLGPGSTGVTFVAAELPPHRVTEQNAVVRRLFRHKVGLPEAILRRSISHLGDPERLHRVLAKLIQGDPITVAAVGGSVTAGVGAETVELCYRERLFDWIRKTFPNEKHAFVDGSLPAAPSSYISQCINDYAPITSDLVFVEFTMNDGQKGCNITTDGRRSFEQLLRKLLAYPKAPAVVILHWWSPMTQDFHVSPQDHLDVFAKFYGLPSLSWRDAVHDLISANASGFTTGGLYSDRAHPNGHNGHRLFADIIISFLRSEAVIASLKASAAPAPASSAGKLESAPLRSPMLPGNFEGKTSCLRGQAFRDVVISSEGWQWSNDGSEERPKWGFLSWEPASKLRLKVNTATYRGSAKIVIAVGTLKSHRPHMGRADLTCEAGCKCGPKLLEGRWNQNSSQTTWEYTTASQTEECYIAIVTSNATGNGKQKVFVNSFLITDVHASGAGWFAHVSDLADNAAIKKDQQHKQLPIDDPQPRR